SSGEPAGHTFEIDLRDSWMIYRDGTYQFVPPETHLDEKVIYLDIDLRKHANSFLWVSSPASFSIFVNGKLSIRATKVSKLSLDSIRQATGVPSLLLAIYQQQGVHPERLHTVLSAEQTGRVAEPRIIDRA